MSNKEVIEMKVEVEPGVTDQVVMAPEVGAEVEQVEVHDPVEAEPLPGDSDAMGDEDPTAPSWM